MANITLSIPEALHARMKKFEEVRWSTVVRNILSKKVSELEIMNKILSKSKLTKKDADELGDLIKAGTYEALSK